MSGNGKQLFEGRVAIVTGAGKGLGRAYATWLAERGCAVVINNRSHPGQPSSAQALVDEIKAAGGRAVAHGGAIEDKRSGPELTELALSEFGRLDILICNAGVMPEIPFVDLDPDLIERLVKINVLGTIYPLQAAWRHMLTTGYGRVVLTASTVGTHGHPGVAAYGATRASGLGLVRSLAQEAPEGSDLRINAILPFAYTNMSSESIDQLWTPELIETIKPDKIAPTVGWLCSEQCRVSGRLFHASALRVTRVGIAESAPVLVDPQDVTRLSDAPFSLEPLFEPSDSVAAVGRLLGG